MATYMIKLLEELKKYIVPLSPAEFARLEENIKKEGCRDPLVVWENQHGELILVDGHNRYKICQLHGIKFKIKKMAFKDIDDARLWMINNQIGRRNLNLNQISYYRGLKYESLKKGRGGAAYFDPKYQSETSDAKEISTSEKLALEFKVGRATIMRDAKFARAINFVGKSNPELKNRILSGDAKVKKSDLAVFADIDDKKNLSFKNEKDLYNKARQIRNNVLNDIENKLKTSGKSSPEKANQELKIQEPVFTDPEDRINRIKGQVLSAMNKAIQKKDMGAIDELKDLIQKLAKVIFED